MTTKESHSHFVYYLHALSKRHLENKQLTYGKQKAKKNSSFSLLHAWYERVFLTSSDPQLCDDEIFLFSFKGYK